MAGIIIAVLLGITGRTVVPYLEALRDKPDTKWERKFWLPPAVSLLIGVIIAPLVFAAMPPESISNVTWQGLAAAFTAAWGLTDIVRSGQKVVSN